MYRNLVLCLLFLTIADGVLHAQTVKAMSYNVRYDNPNDGEDNWHHRKAELVAQIKKHGAGVIGMQEVLVHQLAYLDQELPGHSYIGIGREDGAEKGEFAPIFYDRTKYKLMDSGTFWLSKTPEKVSVGWDAALERICTYVLLEDRKSRSSFWVFNAHFDHRGVKAREKSVKLILKKIRAMNVAGQPVVFMGDLNLAPDQKAIVGLKRHMQSANDATESPFIGPKGTFNSFDPNAPMAKKIDYIFVKGFKVKSGAHLEEYRENGRCISDHLPVLAVLEKRP